jgi:hypothetical protein
MRTNADFYSEVRTGAGLFVRHLDCCYWKRIGKSFVVFYVVFIYKKDKVGILTESTH